VTIGAHVCIQETIPGTALDQRLRREQTEAIPQLVAAHLLAGAGFEQTSATGLAYRFIEIRQL